MLTILNGLTKSILFALSLQTIVTKTNILDLMGLYKQYKPQFDEILFVASHGREERVDSTLCDYDNVLCLESDELVYAAGGEGQVVRSLTAKFRSRFEVSP